MVLAETVSRHNKSCLDVRILPKTFDSSLSPAFIFAEETMRLTSIQSQILDVCKQSEELQTIGRRATACVVDENRLRLDMGHMLSLQTL